MVTCMYVGHWEVRLQSPADPELVATIYIEEENENETHRVELKSRNPPGQREDAVRIYQTWEQCIHAVVAWVRAGRA